MAAADEIVSNRIREAQDFRLTHGMLLKDFTLQRHGPSRLDRILHPRRLRPVERPQALNLPCATKPLGVSVTPTRFPAAQFKQAKELQILFNELYLRITDDHDWLQEVLSPLLCRDPLVTTLWEIYEHVQRQGTGQDVVCGIFRSDYMLDVTTAGVKQVEMNVFSASGFAHAQNVASMHRHIQQVFGGSAELPDNENVDGIADMLAQADAIYRQQRVKEGATNPSYTNGKTCVLMIVQPKNFNIADERPIEYALWSRTIACYRCEWQAILSRTQQDDDETLLFRPHNHLSSLIEVSVVYFRAGYSAYEYVDVPSGPAARLQLELSRAIKCPDIATHLTTCKTVQQALTIPCVVEKLLPAATKDHTTQLRNTFMEMHVLNPSPAGLEARKIVSDPFRVRNYVLKANGDGGGHNVYAGDIPKFLTTISEEQWCNFTLMRMIEAPKGVMGTLLLQNDRHVYQGEVVSELGVLGTCIWRRGKDDITDSSGSGTKGHGGVEVLWNRCAGWTLKSKPRGVEGMMVVKGVGAMDCPDLH